MLLNKISYRTNISMLIYANQAGLHNTSVHVSISLCKKDILAHPVIEA